MGKKGRSIEGTGGKQGMEGDKIGREMKLKKKRKRGKERHDKLG